MYQERGVWESCPDAPLLPVHCTTQLFPQPGLCLSIFPVSLFLLGLLICFLLLSSQLLISSKSHGGTQQEESIRLLYYIFFPLLFSYLTAGYLWKCITASEIGTLEKGQRKKHVHGVARPGETILSPCGNSLFSQCFDLNLQGELASYGVISRMFCFSCLAV